jgi:hypothetical protein
MNPLPDELKYLRSALAELSELPTNELNEDVDLTSVETALRERIRGLNIREATERLKGDCQALKQWAKQSGNSKAATSFVIGVLSYRPGPLARRLLAPAQPAPPEPTIFFEPPDGWSAEPRSLSLQLRAGRKTIGVITIIDDFSFDVLVHQNQIRDEREPQVRIRNPFAVAGDWTKSCVRFGEARGNKYIYRQTQPVPWRSVQYLLSVPDGAVNIVLDARGKEFDEAPFDSRLHTLRIEAEQRAS